jgi:hypothetical protein
LDSQLLSEELTLSKYMKILIESKFPQFQLLDSKEFLEHLKKRGINRNMSDLEFYDKINVVKPVLRLHGSLHESVFKRCHKKLTMFSLKEYLDEKLVELPTDDDYKSWKDWTDSNGDPLCMYYHPVQIVGFEHITDDVKLHLDTQRFLDIDDAEEYVTRVKQNYSKHLESWQKSMKSHWLPRMGFLMLLEESYSPDARQEYFGSADLETSFKKWQEWKSKEFSTKIILKNSSFNHDDIHALYRLLARINHDDPLGHWYPLQSIMKKSRKRQLEGKALVSQDYYDFAAMVEDFIKDEFNEDVLSPDDLGNDNWHERIFGSPFDYDSKKTQNAILDFYMIYPPQKVAIVYEGATEEYVINRILSALRIYLPTSGLSLHNADGADNLLTNFDSFFELAKKEQIDGFVILDQDKKSIAEELVRKGSVTEDMMVVWDNDFELENFGIEKTIEVINDTLKKKDAKTISVNEIKSKLDGNNIMLMNAISDEVRKQNGAKMNSLISKKDIARIIFEPRGIEIEKEFETNKWVPNLPIEIKLQELFRKYPHYL